MSVELAPRATGGAVAIRRARIGRASPGAAGALALRLVAFFALAWVAAAAYATLLVHPPQVRVAALAATATAAGAGLASSARVRAPTAVLTLLRLLVLLVALALALALLGVPVRLLAPAHWGQLGHEVSDGIGRLGSWLWPYRGTAQWSRIAVLAPLVPGLTLAAALCFWPSARRSGERRMLALAVLVGLMVTGLANATPGAWQVQGVLITVLLFAWFWLPTLVASDASRAGAWLVACLLPALLAAPLLEGGEGWFGTHAAGLPQAVSFHWDEMFGPLESPRSTETMLTIVAPGSGLLRVTSLDAFDGQGFVRSGSPPATRALDLRPGARAPGTTRVARVAIAHLRSNLLVGGAGVSEQVHWPAQYATDAITAADGTLELARPLASGASYVVDSYVPAASALQLRGAPRRVPAVYERYTEFELPRAAPTAPQVLVRGNAGALGPSARRALESSPYAPVYELARQLAGGAHGAYEVARNVERFLRSNFSYTETPPRRRYPLVAFLFQDRRGFCQQFAGAMALMLRMDGVPARVGVGFKPTLPAGLAGTRIVRASDAHAWTEVYFAGIGWVSFDPTPAGPSKLPNFSGAVSRSTVLGINGGAASRVARRQHSSAAGTRHGGGAGGLLLAVGAAALLGIALAAASWLLIGTRRAGRALHDGAAPAIEELRRALVRAGWPAASARTLTRVAAALRSDGRGDAAAYVELLRRARFAPAAEEGRSPPSRLEVAKGRAALRRALRRRGGLARRFGALYELPPAIAGGRLR